MIIIVKSGDNYFSYSKMLSGIDPVCREYKFGEVDDAAIVAEQPALIILHHNEPVAHCKRLRAVRTSHYFRILVVLEPEFAAESVRARIAGADSCLAAPVIQGGIQHAVGNEYACVRRWNEAARLVSSNIVVNDRYALKKVLGIGLRASTFLAFDRVSGNEVSIKLLRRMLLAETELVEAFIGEAAKIQTFSSPFMPGIVECAKWEGIPFLALDTGGAKNLYQLLAEKEFSEAEIERLALCVTRALLKMKHYKVLHFDIKPENILWKKDQFLLSGFGVLPTTKAPLDNTYFPYWSDAAYSSPEFFSPSASLTARSDIYSLGVLLYMIATRENPFAGYHYMDARKMHSQGDLVTLPRDRGFSSTFIITVEAMTMLRQEARPRLRDLELIFSQAVELHTLESGAEKRSAGHPADEKTVPPPGIPAPALSTVNLPKPPPAPGKANNASPASAPPPAPAPEPEHDPEMDNVRKARTDSLAKIRSAPAQKTGPVEISWKTILRFLTAHPVMILSAVSAVVLLFLTGYLIGNAKREPTYFYQGSLRMFTCFAGHTHADRTLDLRTVKCRTCGRRTSLSYTCADCRREFGVSLWPLRDMTEEECAEFEEKLKLCPYCKKTKIAPSPIVVYPKPGTKK